MKAKLTIRLDEELVPDGKRLAHAQGVSLSRSVTLLLADVLNDLP